MEKKILILASTSFIGRNVINYLENKKYIVFSLNRKDVDFKNEELLKSNIEKINPDIIINCCGIVGSSIKNTKLNDYDVLNDNIILNMNVLNSCRSLNIKKIILFSSYRLFGDDINKDYDENQIETSKVNYNIGYLTSKKILNTQIKLFIKEYKIDIVCLLMTNIFGYQDDFSINGRIVPSMISNIKYHKNKNTDIVIKSNKNTLVNLVFVDDISRIVEICILKENIIGNIIVFNKDGIITLENLTKKISECFDYKNNIIFENNNIIYKSNIMKPKLDRFNYFFEDFEFSDLDQSLKKTIHSITQIKFE
jgi:nucleoside-diphosphate-sugar epimerase